VHSHMAHSEAKAIAALEDAAANQPVEEHGDDVDVYADSGTESDTDSENEETAEPTLSESVSVPRELTEEEKEAERLRQAEERMKARWASRRRFNKTAHQIEQAERDEQRKREEQAAKEKRDAEREQRRKERQRRNEERRVRRAKVEAERARLQREEEERARAAAELRAHEVEQLRVQEARRLLAEESRKQRETDEESRKQREADEEIRKHHEADEAQQQQQQAEEESDSVCVGEPGREHEAHSDVVALPKLALQSSDESAAGRSSKKRSKKKVKKKGSRPHTPRSARSTPRSSRSSTNIAQQLHKSSESSEKSAGKSKRKKKEKRTKELSEADTTGADHTSGSCTATELRDPHSEELVRKALLASPYPLHHAINAAETDVAMALIRSGKVDITGVDARGDLPLHRAAFCNNHDVMQLLLERGADVNMANVRGGTCLHLAAFKGHFRMVELLIEQGADVNARTTSNQNTPLHRATATQQWGICRLLVRNGADPTLTNNAGRIAFVDQGQVDEAEILLGLAAQEKSTGDETGQAVAESHVAERKKPVEQTPPVADSTTASGEAADSRDAAVAEEPAPVSRSESSAAELTKEESDGVQTESTASASSSSSSSSSSAIQRGRSALQRQRRNSIRRTNDMDSQGSLKSMLVERTRSVKKMSELFEEEVKRASTQPSRKQGSSEAAIAALRKHRQKTIYPTPVRSSNVSYDFTGSLKPIPMSVRKKMIIIDAGSHEIRCGFNGVRCRPEQIYRTTVPGHQLNEDELELSFGTASESVRDLLHPIDDGRIVNWENMEKIWSDMYETKLGAAPISPKEFPVLLAEPLFQSQKERSRIIEVFMETFEVPELCFRPDAALAMYASNHSTGIVVDCGAESTRVVPIYDGLAIRQRATLIPKLGGRHLIAYLRSILSKEPNNAALITRAVSSELCTLKEQHCYVALDYATEMQQTLDIALRSTKRTDVREDPYDAVGYARSVPVKAANGRPLRITTERFRVAEALFKPSHCGVSGMGIHRAVQQTAQALPAEHRNEICSQVLLTGGSSMFPGLLARLQHELDSILGTAEFPLQSAARVLGSATRTLDVWTGGYAYASSILSAYPDLMTTRADYAEDGAVAVHRRCVV